MSVTKPQLLSTGAALRHAESIGVKRADIDKVTIDGKPVDPGAALAELKALERALDEAERRAQQQKSEPSTPNPFARAFKGVTSWTQKTLVDAPGDWIKSNAPVVNDAAKVAMDATNAVAMTKPEDVDRPATVRITTKDGRAIDIPVRVRDELATQILKATSATASGAGFIPVFGNLVQGGTGLAAMVASGASYLFGDKQLGDAFLGMGKKHLVMGIVGFVPVVSLATAPAALEDMRRMGDAGVRVDEMVLADGVRHDAPVADP